MKSLTLLILIPLFIILAIGDDSANRKKVAGGQPVSTAINCAPEPAMNSEPADGRVMVALPGWGKHHFTISTKNDSAQFFFNQGLNMYYSYHWREANASFREAARFDPESAMAYWGQLLARGPAYNFAHGYKMPDDIPQLVEKMNALTEKASGMEKDMMHAMTARYSSDLSDKERKKLNAAYASEMKALTEKYSNEQDILALYVDGVMLQHPWSFWNNDGTSKAWTDELVSLCEKIFEINPHHPGALHYYIHVTEASRTPQRATTSADLLKDLLPGVAHMVHMSSHVYERNGSYAKGVEVNETADIDLMRYDSIVQGLNTISLSKHVSHYFAVQTYCALAGGMYKKGMPLAERARNSVSPGPSETYQQYVYMMPVLAQVRMGKWKEIMDDNKEIPGSWTYASLLSDFAKGMSSVRIGNTSNAKKYLAQLRSKSKDSILKIINIPFNSPSQGAYIAEHILNAAILSSEKKNNEAIASLHKAIQMEDSLIYVEPKDWPLPARQYLGALLMKLKRPAEAEKIYREDLQWNPGNGWSLLGLTQSLAAQGKEKQAIPYRNEYKSSFSAADEIPPASVY